MLGCDYFLYIKYCLCGLLWSSLDAVLDFVFLFSPNFLLFFYAVLGIFCLSFSQLEIRFGNIFQGLHQRRPTSGMGQAAGFMGRSHLNDQMYGHFGTTYRGGSGFGLNYYNPKSSWQNWRAVDNKYTSKGRNNGFFSYGNESNLNELSKGPRSKDLKSQLGFGSVKLAVKGQDLSLKANNKEENPTVVADKEQYNKEDFPETYSDAKFFVIKSYSEDDVHKSIKYNVWASTPNGNKKLDAAYQEAQGKSDGCPLFLLFSVSSLLCGSGLNFSFCILQF